jgi:exopolyphosphatase / guanosine-5'-triphosphate,3'-diphosphate pyrophosphatase
MGFSLEERSIVANVARYHRKGLPDPAHPNFRDLDKDARARVRSLAAILRVADALDREHLGKVTGVRAEVDEARRRVVLHLQGEADRELEEWTVKQKGDLLRDEFGLEVTLPSPKTEPPPARGK